MTLNQLYLFLRNFYGYKAQVLGLWEEQQEIDLILYDSFSITCGFDEHGSFGATVNLPKNLGTTYFVGFDCSLIENNETSIKNALQKIDEYCRLRLPDKFLEMYDKVYRRKGHYIKPGEVRR